MGKVYPVTLSAEMQRRGGGTRSVNNNMGAPEAGDGSSNRNYI